MSKGMFREFSLLRKHLCGWGQQLEAAEQKDLAFDAHHVEQKGSERWKEGGSKESAKDCRRQDLRHEKQKQEQESPTVHRSSENPNHT